MRFVIIESPFAGPEPQNMIYAREAMLDSLQREEAPFLSHLLYTQVLDDNSATQRRQGIEAGLAIGERADATVVYTDLGISAGMARGIREAILYGREVEYRTIRRWPENKINQEGGLNNEIRNR